jgi:hypothetical protein
VIMPSVWFGIRLQGSTARVASSVITALANER